MSINILPENWSAIFIPELPILELIIRGVILYLGILLILRALHRRATGSLSAMDLVFILLLSEVATHAMGDYTSIGDAIILFLVFMACNYVVNQLTFRSKFFKNLFEHSALQVVENGKINYRNMRRELLTKEELRTHLREHGVEDLMKVKKAFIESDGDISFIFFDEKDSSSE